MPGSVFRARDGDRGVRDRGCGRWSGRTGDHGIAPPGLVASAAVEGVRVAGRSGRGRYEDAEVSQDAAASVCGGATRAAVRSGSTRARQVPVRDVPAGRHRESRLTQAQVSGPGSASATSSSGSTPPSRCFSDARITARILANSSVADMSGSLPRWSSASPGAGVRSLMARSSSRSRIPCPARFGSLTSQPGRLASLHNTRRQPVACRSTRTKCRLRPVPARLRRPGAPPSLAAKRNRAGDQPEAGAANGSARRACFLAQRCMPFGRQQFLNASP